ncbi:hypothetical protein CRG98_026075 [Punica granatum]|uniref:Uncharacterized protein n=1 Tax=Punica granatum TaxID=22663 RepID=A0A2I0JC80_PUNGR|nr:hypothetical protein CRG98_026075 [Punica granatum]
MTLEILYVCQFLTSSLKYFNLEHQVLKGLKKCHFWFFPLPSLTEFQQGKRPLHVADVALCEWSRVGSGPDVGVESSLSVSFFTQLPPHATRNPSAAPTTAGTVAPRVALPEPDQFPQVRSRLLSVGSRTIPTPNVGRPFSSVLETQSKNIYQAFDVGLRQAILLAIGRFMFLSSSLCRVVLWSSVVRAREEARQGCCLLAACSSFTSEPITRTSIEVSRAFRFSRSDREETRSNLRELIGLRRGCSRCYGTRNCRGGARVSSRMGRESGEEGDTRARPDYTRHPDPNQLVTTHEAPRGGPFALLEFC